MLNFVSMLDPTVRKENIYVKYRRKKHRSTYPVIDGTFLIDIHHI